MPPMPLLLEEFVRQAEVPDFRLAAVAVPTYLKFMDEFRLLVQQALNASELDESAAISQFAAQIDAAHQEYYELVITGIITQNREPSLLEICIIADWLNRLVNIRLTDVTDDALGLAAEKLIG